MITAQEARDLAPRGYIPTEQLYMRIKSIAEKGERFLWTDLTLQQIDELEANGYKVKKPESYGDKRSYRVDW